MCREASERTPGKQRVPDDVAEDRGGKISEGNEEPILADAEGLNQRAESSVYNREMSEGIDDAPDMFAEGPAGRGR